MKYKLIKEYPGSPKLGNTIDNLENDWIENYPEFWEEVVEKDYEILSFYNEDNNFCKVNKTNYMEKFVLANLHIFKIHSVKRNDGEIFTIGDKDNNQGEITSFEIDGNYLFVNIDSKYQYTLRTLKKLKQPLFTTEDGVDIFAGMSFYYVCQELELYNTICCTDEKKYKNAKQFSTKEKAEEYILLNKPCLSLKNIADLSLKSYTTIELGIKLRKLVKSKIQQSV